MKSISNGVLVVRPTRKFMTWLNGLDRKNKVTMDELGKDAAAYVIPKFEDEQEACERLWDYCEVIFRHQLERIRTVNKSFIKNLEPPSHIMY